MGTSAHVVVVGDPTLLDSARRRIADLEQRWSRFIATSEVSELNRRRGRAVAVSADTFELVRASVEAWARTGGRFDPTVLGDVLRAGYDDTYAIVAVRGGHGASLLRRNAGGVVLDPSRLEVTLPADAGFDPGGIGKGLAADLVVTELLTDGAEGVCVNLGGDLRVEGASPTGDDRWVVALDERDPVGVAPIHIGLEAGGVATSTIAKRTWRDDGRPVHHVIDPATGRNGSGAVTVTAISRTAAGAEVAATAALLAPPSAALDALADLGADGVIDLASGERLASPHLHLFQLEPSGS